ncbi:hypothetical protein [Fischerella sp. PCC 9605]|uniref:hypothetical protein n=1 Tax=Fischerella sp. PCC 9605 TaxID=1173024 RepID=UPI00047C94C9|nr:hypothetical protein [Fischerella sp. PCC 9605]
MNPQDLNIKSKKGLLGSIFGGLLIGLPIIPFAASAAPSSVLNPCPRIFYEEPHNNRVLVPEGCPPNAATLRLREQGETALREGFPPQATANPKGGVVVQPRILVEPGGLPVNRQTIPAPETRQNAIANITPTAGTVDVRLKNNTNARISYQAIAYTQPQILAGGEEYVLQDLPTPVTVTMVREDGGFIQAKPIPTSSEGVLAITLDETANFSNSDTALRIQRDGQVFLN